MARPDDVVVFVAHDDPVIEAGFRAVLDCCPGLRSVNDSLGVGWKAVNSSNAELLVADYRNGMAWLERSAEYRRAATPRVVIVTSLSGECEVRAALAAGVSGYVLQGCDIAELRLAAVTAARGARYISPSVAQRLADSLAHAALTARESDVLKLIAAGMCNKTIARELDISIATVKSHVSSILEKLCASSRTQAVSKASGRGLIAPAAPHVFDAGRLSSCINEVTAPV